MESGILNRKSAHYIKLKLLHLSRCSSCHVPLGTLQIPLETSHYNAYMCTTQLGPLSVHILHQISAHTHAHARTHARTHTYRQTCTHACLQPNKQAHSQFVHHLFQLYSRHLLGDNFNHLLSNGPNLGTLGVRCLLLLVRGPSGEAHDKQSQYIAVCCLHIHRCLNHGLQHTHTHRVRHTVKCRTCKVYTHKEGNEVHRSSSTVTL